MIMTEALLQKICIESDLYKTPELNEVLYCNFKGFSAIGGLQRYTALKAFFLEGNSLHSLSGLPFCSLSCLYVQNNRIDDLSALQNLPQLKVLNVSHNQLSSLEGLEACPALHTLICSNNKLASVQSIIPLQCCLDLTTLDIQDNVLDDAEVLTLLTRMEQLCSLYVKGNGFPQSIRNFRKNLIAKLPCLSYLDDRSVFPIERRGAEAWSEGGPDAEQAARQNVAAEKQAAERENMSALMAMRAASFRKRREALGLPPGDTDPFFDRLQEDDREGSEPEDLECPGVAAGKDIQFSEDETEGPFLPIEESGDLTVRGQTLQKGCISGAEAIILDAPYKE